MHDVKADTNTNSKADQREDFELPFPELPHMQILTVFRGLAEQTGVRMKKSHETMKLASEEWTAVLRESYSTSTRCAADCGAKVFELSSANASSAIDFVGELISARSPADLLKLSAAQTRRNIDLASAQNREFWDLIVKVANETTEPMKNGAARVLQKVS